MSDRRHRSRLFELQRRASRRLLGPIWDEYCHRLRLSLGAYDPATTVAWFVARGGVRMRVAFDAHCRRVGDRPACPVRDAYLSRVAVAKALVSQDPSGYAHYLSREFHHTTGSIMLRSLVPGLDGAWTSHLDAVPATRQVFLDAYFCDHPLGETIRAYLDGQRILLREYLRGLLGGSRTCVLVDTGWTGNTQAMLMRLEPDVEWVGLYFGRWDYRGETPGHFYNVHGLGIEVDRFRLRHVHSWILAHYHLIEAPMEMPAPSVDGYCRRGGGVAPVTGAIPDWSLANVTCGSHFAGIMQWIKDARRGRDPGWIRRRARSAYRRLGFRLLFPTRSDASALSVLSRSADFGKDERVSVLVRPRPRGLCHARDRLRRTLWVPGQTAREWPSRFVHLPVQTWYALTQGSARGRVVCAGFIRFGRWLRSLVRSG